jgi:hypothetical protein
MLVQLTTFMAQTAPFGGSNGGSGSKPGQATKKLLLLDEPLGALDKKLPEQAQFELVNIIETVGVYRDGDA